MRITSRLRPSRRRVGAFVMALSLVGGVAVLGNPVAAQEPEPETTPIEQTQIALFASPDSDAVPNTVVNSFPPQVVCVVQPAFCGENSEPIRNPITGAIQEADQSAEPSPVAAADEDTLTLTYESGAIKFQSGLTFELPPVPEGNKVDSFVLSVDQINPTYAGDSPAFRAAVLTAVATAGSRDPAVFQDAFMRALDAEPASQPQIGIEVCPFQSPYPIVPNGEELSNEPTEDPNAGAPPTPVSDEQIPEKDSDGDGLPEPNVECVLGTNGVLNEAGDAWSFDLTFTLQAWADGTLENNGIFLRPTGVPFLAFGDPDTSFNAQVTLDATTAAYTVATSEPPPPVAPLAPLPPPPPPAPAAEPAPVQSSAPAPVQSQAPAFTPAPITSSGGGGFQSGSAPVITNEEPPVAAAPEPAPEAAPEAPVQQEVAQDLAVTPIEEQGAYWLLWLLIPIFLGGMYMTQGALTDEELVLADGGPERSGAMTRLIQNREAQTGQPITA